MCNMLCLLGSRVAIAVWSIQSWHARRRLTRESGFSPLQVVALDLVESAELLEGPKGGQQFRSMQFCWELSSAVLTKNACKAWTHVVAVPILVFFGLAGNQ